MHQESYILVVDDTPEHLRTAASILKSYGYHVRIATNGQKALDIIFQSPPAIVLLDIRMTDMDGFHVLKEIRTSPKMQNVAVIIVTADHDRYNLQKGFSLGAQDYILKPYHASELIARINNQMKLYHRTQDLKAASAELGQFCHNVSHDLKAPIHFISLLAQEMCVEVNRLSGNSSPELLSMQEQLISRCDRTVQMVEHLLKFAELSESVLHFEQIPLSPFLAEIATELINLHPRRDIHLNLPSDLPTVSGDFRLLTHLFHNIVGNAVKYTAGRTPAILTFHWTEDEFFYHISLSDNGIGISEPDPERLFQVFKRGCSEMEGSGVGLAIVKRIASLHGGHVSLEGKPDAGATVCLSLPKGFL